ncbi:small integral membrane protein 14 [Pararge aegeria]|nr:small integral membrane protein 14 [Pararge aegeria]
MGDETDPCECIWNNELMMRRIISMLRHGQSYCTDNDCLEPRTGSGPAAQSDADGFLIMFLMLAVAFVMYIMRPRRNQIQDAAKPTANPQDRDGAPPTPPRI